MNNPNVRSVNSDNTGKRGRQRDRSDNPVGNRILQALGDNTRKWLAEKTGLPASTISDAIISGISKAETAVAIANGLGVSLDWLLTGRESIAARTGPADLSHVDLVDVPEYDLRELTDETRGPIVTVTPVRKDWLNRTLNQATGLWLTRLPADLPRYDLRQGDLVFARDVEAGEAQDGATYIVRVWGHLTVARIDAMLGNRMSSIEGNLQDRALAPRDIGTEDGQAILVARVLGAPLRRL